MYGLPVLLNVSYLSSPWSLPWQPSQTYQVQAQILLVDVKSLSDQFINYLISIKSYVSWHLYQLDLVVFCQFHQELMVVPGWFGIYLEAVKGLDGCLTVRMNIDVPTCVAFSIFSIMQTLMAYISTWYIVVWAQDRLCPLLKPHLYTPAPVPFLVLDRLCTRPGSLFCLGWTCSAIHICQRTCPYMSCGIHTSEA